MIGDSVYRTLSDHSWSWHKRSRGAAARGGSGELRAQRSRYVDDHRSERRRSAAGARPCVRSARAALSGRIVVMVHVVGDSVSIEARARRW